MELQWYITKRRVGPLNQRMLTLCSLFVQHGGDPEYFERGGHSPAALVVKSEMDRIGERPEDELSDQYGNQRSFAGPALFPLAWEWPPGGPGEYSAFASWHHHMTAPSPHREVVSLVVDCVFYSEDGVQPVGETFLMAAVWQHGLWKPLGMKPDGRISVIKLEEDAADDNGQLLEEMTAQEIMLRLVAA